jgi:Bacterial PH domain
VSTPQHPQSSPAGTGADNTAGTGADNTAGTGAHNPATSGPDDAAALPGRRYVIRIQKLAYLAVLMLFISVSFPVIGWPAAFGWLLVLPIGVAVWVVRSRTVITSETLELRSMFGSRSVAWTDVDGVRFPKRGWARAHLNDGTEVTLPAVGFDRLRELAAASGGRVPDPYLAPRPAAPEASAAEAESEQSAESGRNGSAE